MVEKDKDVTEAELAVLRCLWANGPLTARQLADQLYPDRKSSHAATVHKLLERLEAKNIVERDASGPSLVFSATVDRDDLIGRRLQALADSLCDGSQVPLLMRLVDQKRMTKAEIETLRALIDELYAEQASKESK